MRNFNNNRQTNVKLGFRDEHSDIKRWTITIAVFYV